jgi:hypothetical protein
MIRIISALAITFTALTFSSCGCKPKLKTPAMQPLPKFQDPRSMGTPEASPAIAEVEEIVEIPVSEAPVIDAK